MTDKPRIEKRVGYDWDVTYITEGENGKDETSTMAVFGAMSIEEAIRDAKSSFLLGEPCVISVVRRH